MDAPTDLRFVPAQEKDVPLVLKMIRALAEYARLAHEVVATEADLRNMLFGPRPGPEVVFAYDGKDPVGFALFFHNFSTFLGRPGIYLEDLFVIPEARGRGIGGKLLSHVAALAVARGCERLEWSVLDWNEDAIRFYRKIGARPKDEWVLYRLAGPGLRQLATGTPAGDAR